MTLREASAGEAAARDALTFEAWGAPLSREQWLSREAALRAHPWSRQAMRTWFLEEGGEVVSSLETFEMPSRLRAPEGPARGVSWAVASVFTEPRLRGKGYASRLLAELEKAARARGDVQALLLFSDVGEAIYARAGYEVLPRADWVVPPTPGNPLERVDGLLTSVDPDALGRAMVGIESGFLIRPTGDQLDWALERSRFYARALGRSLPAACGARIGTSLAYWRVHPQKRLLEVLFLSAKSETETHALLTAAAQVAYAAALREVRAWESGLPPDTALLPGASRVEREGSWPMLRPLAMGVHARGLTFLPRALWV